MKTLRIELPVLYKFFGGAKPIEEQSFETKLDEFRQKAYDDMPDEHSHLRARCVIDNGINAIKTLLRNLWNTTEKLKKVKWPVINIQMMVDNDYSAYSVLICYRETLLLPKYETAESSNFEEAVQAERDEFLHKYGFTELPQKQYHVEFDNHEAVLSDTQLKEINKEHPELYYKLLIKDAT